MADEGKAKRALALEDKKRRLQELKARRNTRTGSRNTSTSTTSSSVAGDKNLDKYIEGLLATTPPAAPGKEKEEVPKEDEKEETKVVEVVKVVEAPAPLPPPPPPVSPVKKTEVFTIGTQTEEDDFPPELTPSDNETANDEQVEEPEIDKTESKESEEEEEGPPSTLTPLSEEDKQAAISSEHFSSFLDSASKKVERLLGAPILADLLLDADYAGEEEDKEEDTRKASGGLISARHVFECPRWTRSRDITDIDYSPVHKELLLASYHMSSSSSPETPTQNVIKPTHSSTLAPQAGETHSDGLALIFSLAMHNRPEHIFTCPSPILSSRFHPTEHHLVLGGCHSGQLCVWDLRSGRLPVLRSTIFKSGEKTLMGHSHPVCALEVVEGGRGIVTASTEGRLNFWSLEQLRDPAESVKVAANVSSLAVASESNAILCGDESGGVHAILPSASAGRTSGVGRRVARKFDAGDQGHFGMVTGVSTRVLREKREGRRMSKGFLTDAGGLFLTCGVDWTTKLWAPAYGDKPLLSLLSPSYDYMCDVQWSPTHPSIFATSSTNGTLGIWDLSFSLDEALSGSKGITVDNDNPTAAQVLNKIKWSQDGRRIAVASGEKMHVLGVVEEVSRGKEDEEERMMENLVQRGLLEEKEL